MSFRMNSLNALRIFEVVMRHQSLKGAAEELCITPQAVSHQIRGLEETLGKSLFERSARGFHPTQVASALVVAVRRGLDEIAEGIRVASQSDKEKNRLYLHVTPYFASHYLIPYLREFTESYTHIDLKISVGTNLPDFERAQIDAAILWGYGAWATVRQVRLIEDFKVLAGQPDLLKRKPIRTPEDLLGHTLLNPFEINSLWGETLTLLGLEGRVPQSSMTLHTHGPTLDATLAGLGIALISHLDAEDGIQNGRLIAPFGKDLLRGLPPNRVPYFFLLFPDRPDVPKEVLAFQRWLRATLLRHHGRYCPDV